MPGSGDLLDVNVWLSLAAEAHTRHDRAVGYWHTEAAGLAIFCRTTQLAFLRHLTNRSVMGAHTLAPAAAWTKWTEFMSLSEVTLLEEPAGLTTQLGKFSNTGRTSPNLWTDAYLAAFSKCAGLRLVTFDQGFSRFPGLEVLILKAN